MKIYLALLFFSLNIVAADYQNKYEQEPRYKYLSRVGQGTYGVVLEIDDHVMKICPIDFAGNSAKNILEAALLLALNHDSIPKPIEIKIHRGIKNNFLEIHLPKYQRSYSSQSENILASMISILAYLNQLKFINGDIKKDHILWHKKFPVLIDWGSAQIFSSQPVMQCSTTASYCSVELLTNQFHYPEKDDLWALGIALLEIHHNIDRLLNYPSMRKILENIITKRNDNNASLDSLNNSSKPSGITLSPKLTDLIEKIDRPMVKEYLTLILNIDPNQRPSAQELLSRLPNPINLTVHKLAETPKTIFNQNDQITPKERREVYLWLYSLIQMLNLPARVLFEAMSINDQFINTSVVQKDDIKFVASMALFLAADFHREGWEIDTFIAHLDASYTHTKFKQSLITALEHAQFKLIYRHVLRDYQDDIFSNNLHDDEKSKMILILTMLEMHENTYTYSNEEKWLFLTSIMKSLKEKQAFALQATWAGICNDFKGQILSFDFYFKDVCREN